jgi:hypothetical protein
VETDIQCKHGNRNMGRWIWNVRTMSHTGTLRKDACAICSLFNQNRFSIPSLSTFAPKSTRFRCGIFRSNLQAANRAAAERPWRVTTSSVSRIPGGHGKLRCGISGSNQQARLWCPDVEEFFMSVKLFRFLFLAKYYFGSSTNFWLDIRAQCKIWIWIVDAYDYVQILYV